jgi:glycosyltransferase involved in cell wall biosynthesis
MKLSVFITTLNNESTLARCLGSVHWADEIVLLDSFSTDGTLKIAQTFGARIFQESFKGYGAQKRSALEKTTHQWVLLLDADEALTPLATSAIRARLANPQANGYALPRVEQMFWTFAASGTRHNFFLRLFDKTHGEIDDLPIHAAPKVRGRVEKLNAPFVHFGEPSIARKIEKLNAYSSGLASARRARPWRMLLRPPLSFFRHYVFKRQFLNGWAGLIHSCSMAFYDFLKEAKAYERTRDPTPAPRLEGDA